MSTLVKVNIATSPNAACSEESESVLSNSTEPIFLRFIVFFAVHLLKVSNGETETELFWGSWLDKPVSYPTTSNHIISLHVTSYFIKLSYILNYPFILNGL